MTVQTTTNVATGIGNGVTTVFPVGYKFNQDADLVVFLIETATSVATLQTLNSDYSVQGAGDDDGGSVTFTINPPATGYSVKIVRMVDLLQLTDLRNQGKFFAEVHEDAFDLLTMMIQQLSGGIKDAMQLNEAGDQWVGRGVRVSDVADPVEPQDAVTKQWMADYVDNVSGEVNTTTGIAYDGGTLYTYLQTGVARIVDSVDDLRALSASRNKRVTQLGYYARGDSYPLDRYVDESDTTSPDDGFSVIVGHDGARWKFPNYGFIDVRWAGARPDDATDSSDQINQCLIYAGLNGISNIKMFGAYVGTDTLIVDYASYFKGVHIEGACALFDRFRQTGAGKDAFWWSTTQYLRNSSLKNLGIYCEANAGHGVNIKFGCTLNRFQDVNITVLNPTKSCYCGIWSGVALGDPQGVFDTTWEGGDLYITDAHTAFGIDFVTNGTTFNENNFRRMRWNNGNGLQFARFTNVDTATYLEGNTIDGINFEICSGGGIFVTNAKGWKISTLSFWDQGGAYNNHLVHFGANGGLESTNNVLELIKRNGDTMSSGKRDIFIEAGQDTTLINCFTDPGNAPSYDFNNKRVTVIGPLLSGALNTANTAYLNAMHGVTASGSFVGATAAASAAYNVGSIVRSSAGLYRVTFVAPRANTNYQVHVSTSTEVLTIWQVSKTSGYFDIKVSLPGGGGQDMVNIDFKVFG